MPDAWPMVEAMHRFLRAPVGGGSQRRILSDHPELLNFGIEYIDEIAGKNLALCYPGLTRSDAQAKLKAQRTLLVRCGQIGVARAFSEIDARRGGTPSPRQLHSRAQQTDRRSCASAFFLTALALAIAIAAGILIYNHVTKKPPKIPAVDMPQITNVTTYRKGPLVYFRLHYRDPHHHAEGFGFVGANGSGWAEENHPFTNPSYGIPGPGSIDYPFNLGCGTANQGESDVEAWIYDTSGDRSRSVVIHLACGQ